MCVCVFVCLRERKRERERERERPISPRARTVLQAVEVGPDPHRCLLEKR